MHVPQSQRATPRAQSSGATCHLDPVMAVQRNVQHCYYVLVQLCYVMTCVLKSQNVADKIPEYLSHTRHVDVFIYFIGSVSIMGFFFNSIRREGIRLFFQLNRNQNLSQCRKSTNILGR